MSEKKKTKSELKAEKAEYYKNKNREWWNDIKIRYSCFKGNQILWKGEYWPIREMSTPDLIIILNGLRNKKQPNHNDIKKLKYLGWIVSWRNDQIKNLELPRDLVYNPTSWDLNKVTEYNYPENIHELSLLYRKALLRGDAARTLLMQKILYSKGYVYIPAHYDNHNFKPSRIERMDRKKVDEDMQILKLRSNGRKERMELVDKAKAKTTEEDKYKRKKFQDFYGKKDWDSYDID